MKTIVVSVSNDLATDQRVAKVCDTLQELDFNVILVGRKLKNSLPLHRSYTTKRMRLLVNKGVLFYIEYAIRLFFLLLFTKKDILLANDLDTLLPNFLISKLQGKKLVYDSHELFTEIPELAHRPFKKSMWLTLEKWIIPTLKNAYTVSKSIADFYTEKYGTKFIVIRNLPVLKDVTPSRFPFKTGDKKIILYQGALNIGRGLELMIDTMQHLNSAIFVLIGDGDISTQLKKSVTEKKLQNRVFFIDKISPEELHKLTPLADIGISLEEDFGLNYRFALPNKIFDYIQASVPVLVADLPEMKQIILQHKIGEITTNRNPKNIALQLTEMLKKDFSVGLQNAKTALIWKHEKEKLQILFKNLQY